MSDKLVALLPEDGILYGAVDVPDGEHTVNELRARTAAQAKAFEKVYAESTSGMDFSGRDPAAKVALAKKGDSPS